MNDNRKETDYNPPWVRCIECKQLKPQNQYSQDRLKQSIHLCKDCDPVQQNVQNCQSQHIYAEEKLDALEKNALASLINGKIWEFGKYIAEWNTFQEKHHYRDNPFIDIVGPDGIEFAIKMWKGKNIECELFLKYSVRNETC